MLKLKEIWRDPVGSKIIAAVIIALISTLISAITTYFQTPIPERQEKSIIWLILNYNVSISLFIIIVFASIITLGLIFILFRSKVFKYDIFVSAPMSGFSDNDEFLAFKEICNEVIEALKHSCEFKNIYWAGENSDGDWTLPHVALKKDIFAMRNSKRFVLIHPKKMQSSTLFESGYMYRKGIRSVYFVQNLSDLPYMMQQLNDYSSFVSVITVDKISAIPKIIKREKREIFDCITNGSTRTR